MTNKALAAKMIMGAPLLLGEDVPGSMCAERMRAEGETCRWEVVIYLLDGGMDPKLVQSLVLCEGVAGSDRFHSMWWFYISMPSKPAERADMFFWPVADLVERGMMHSDALRFFSREEDPDKSDRARGNRRWNKVRAEMYAAAQDA